MTPPIPLVITDSRQAWRLIEKDYILRLSLVAPKWATEHLRSWNAVWAEGRKRGNTAYYGPALVEMEIADADKRAEWNFKTCCEIWEIQGRAKCRPFFRAVFDWCLQPMFATREGCFKSGLELHQKRTAARMPQGAHIHGHMRREMGKLIARWNTKLEIATRDAEHLQRVTHERESEQKKEALRSFRGSSFEQASPVSSTLNWRELEIRFRDLHAKTTEQRVSADFIRTEWESGTVREEWILGGNAAWRAEFEAVSSIAARRSGYSQIEGAADYWINRVREWMRQKGLDRDKTVSWPVTGTRTEAGLSGTTQGIYTYKIAELSALLCMELMAHETPESTFSLPSEQLKPPIQLSGPNAGKRAGRKRTRNSAFCALAGTLWKEEQAKTGAVKADGLKRIGEKLEAAGFVRPADHLERDAAKSLNAHNRQFGASDARKIMTWTALVQKGDKDQIRAMRRLLYRCADDVRKSISDKKEGKKNTKLVGGIRAFH